MKPKRFNGIFVWLRSAVEIVFLQSGLSISLCKNSLWHMTFFFLVLGVKSKSQKWWMPYQVLIMS